MHLPESELDRFTLQLKLGTPGPDTEKQILRGIPQKNLSQLPELISHEELVHLQTEVAAVTVSEAFLDLTVRFLNHSRALGEFLSPRAGRDLVRVSQAIAFLRQRNFVTADDLKFCLPAVIGHRTKDADGIIQRFAFQA